MVPGNVIFANDGGTKFTYDDVRSQSENERLKSLELRLNGWLIGQMTPMGDKTVYAPFPLSIMTCVAIESTAHIFLRCEANTDNGRELFHAFLLLMDSKFKPPMQKGFLKTMRKRWPKLDFSDCKSVPNILYKSFRNKLTHAYHSFGVYITEDETESWDYGDGFLHVNPYWFWKTFQQTYNALFASAHAADNTDAQRNCCIDYINQMLD